MIGSTLLYLTAGLVFALFAGLSVFNSRAPRRWGNGLFYVLIAVELVAAPKLGDFGNGLLVLALVAVAGSGLMKPERSAATNVAPEPQASSNRVFIPALTIPATALFGTFVFKAVPTLVDPKQATLVALAVGVLLALGLCYKLFRPRVLVPFREGARLMDSIGWAALLPQMLAALGAIFALSGVGTAVGGLVQYIIPHNNLLGTVIVYGLGMALFTMVIGNAFAAFPIMTAAIGVPLLIHHFGGNPAIVAALGMLAGFCGTLMTPMAANFNLVPAALLDLKDRYGVIRAQVATALPMLCFNIALLYMIGFPR